MIVAVACRKASPGATTVTAQLAVHWHEPGSVRLLVEADSSGGTLAARWSVAHGLTWDPGLLSLSTSRRDLDPTLLAEVGQQLADDLWVAAAPPAPEQISAALTRLGDRGAAALAGAPGIRAFVDCGRLSARSPSMTLARRSAVTILVARPRLEEVHALVPTVTELSLAGCPMGLVCVGSGPYPPADVAASLGLELFGVLPVDTKAAGAFERDGLAAGRAYHRSPLARAAAELADIVRARSIARVGGPRLAESDARTDGIDATPAGAPAEPTEGGPAASELGVVEFPVSLAVLAARASSREQAQRPAGVDDGDMRDGDVGDRDVRRAR